MLNFVENDPYIWVIIITVSLRILESFMLDSIRTYSRLYSGALHVLDSKFMVLKFRLQKCWISSKMILFIWVIIITVSCRILETSMLDSIRTYIKKLLRFAFSYYFFVSVCVVFDQPWLVDFRVNNLHSILHLKMN